MLYLVKIHRFRAHGRLFNLIYYRKKESTDGSSRFCLFFFNFLLLSFSAECACVLLVRVRAVLVLFGPRLVLFAFALGGGRRTAVPVVDDLAGDETVGQS